MINKGAKGNIIIKTQQLPYSILWDSSDPTILDTYGFPNEITSDDSHNWMLQKQIKTHRCARTLITKFPTSLTCALDIC